MIAVILAAGTGSRLRPLTCTTPKPLISVGGVPLLKKTLGALMDNGIRKAVVVTGYLAEDITAFLRESPLPMSVDTLHNPLYATTANTYSLWLTAPLVRGKAFVLLDGDILFASEVLTALLADAQQDGLVMRRTAHLDTEEVKVELDPHHMVTRIGKDIPPERAAGESLGIEKFSPAGSEALFRALDGRKDRHEFYEASFQQIIDEGVRMHAVDSGALPCMEIDTLEDLEAAHRLAAEYRL